MLKQPFIIIKLRFVNKKIIIKPFVYKFSMEDQYDISTRDFQPEEYFELSADFEWTIGENK